MCRSIAEGNRKCPCQSDPQKRAQYNTRKRAVYFAKKMNISCPDTGTQEYQQLLEKMPIKYSRMDKLNVTSRELKSYHENWDHKVDEIFEKYDDLYSDKKNLMRGNVIYQDKLNISTVSNDGALVDNHYFSSHSVQGVPNYNVFDEESYKMFGFDTVDDDYDKKKIRSRVLEDDDMYDLSSMELRHLSFEEMAALRFYSSGHFEQLNTILYHGESHLDPFQNGEDTSDFFTGDNLFRMDSYSLDVVAFNKKFVQELTGYLDSALEQGPKMQRVVYRGMSDDRFYETGGTAHDWLKKNIALGQEIVFDGYQSTTYSYRTAKNTYAEDNGVVFEIMTPDGLNITAVSEFEEEQEVLLPRKSRYMVVGVHEGVKADIHGSDSVINVVQLIAINDTGEIVNADNKKKLEKVFE